MATSHLSETSHLASQPGQRLMALSSRELCQLALEEHSAEALSLLATRCKAGTLKEREAASVIRMLANGFKTRQLPKKRSSDTLPSLPKLAKNIAFGFLSLTGTAYNVINTFISMGHLISLIPGLTNPVSLTLWAANPLSAALCLAFSAASLYLFWSFEIGFLKQTLGCHRASQVKETLLWDEQEIEATSRLKQQLSDLPANQRQDKWSLAMLDLANAFTRKLFAKKYQYQETPKETRAHHYTHQFLNLVGGIMNIAGAYFAGQVLLSIIAAPLLGTPVGWALIGINILSSIGLYISKRWNTPNPAMKKFEDNKEKLDRFITLSTLQDKVLRYEDRIEREKQNSLGIQKKLSDTAMPVRRPKTAPPHKTVLPETRPSSPANAGFFSSSQPAQDAMAATPWHTQSLTA